MDPPCETMRSTLTSTVIDSDGVFQSTLPVLIVGFFCSTLTKEAMDFHFRANISDKQSRMKIQMFQNCFGDLYFISLLMVGFSGAPFHTKDGI